MAECGCRTEEFQTVLCATHWDAFIEWLDDPTPDPAPALVEAMKRQRRFIQIDE